MPQQNILSQRYNSTHLDMVISMMAPTNLLTSFWGDTLLIVAHIFNHIPSKSMEATPYEL